VQQKDQSSSVFGEVTFQFADSFKAKLGARYTDVSKNGVGISKVWAFPVIATPAGPAPTGFVAPTVVTLNNAFTYTLPNMNYDDTSTDPAVTLEWRPMQDALVYASWRKGFKAGGINHGLDRFPLTATFPYDAAEIQAIADLNTFRPERVKYYELGAKFTFLDGAARLNVSAFKGDYTDLQVAIFNSETAGIETTNAGEARSQGVELDGAWAPSDHWRLNAAVTFLDAKYLDFKYIACYTNPPQTAAQGCAQVPGAPVGTLGQDRSGQSTQFAPDFSGTFSVQYRSPLSMQLFSDETVMTVTASAYNSSEYFTDNSGDPDSIVSRYTTADLRLGLAAANGRWEIALLGRNLGDKLIPLWIGNQPQATVAGPNAGNGTHFATTRRGRELALQFHYAFGK
jgi:outer membrane receptor protein involved in Fe transport